MIEKLIEAAAASPCIITERSVGLILRMLEAMNSVDSALVDRDGVFHWCTTSFAGSLGVGPGVDINLSMQGSPEWSKERIFAAREIIDSRSPRRFLEIFNGRFVETVGVPVDLDCGEKYALVVLLPKRSPTPVPVGPAIQTRVLSAGHWGALAILTRRQLDVLRLITIGKSNPEIATHLGRTRRAIEWHVHELLRILGARDRIALHRLGSDAGFAEIDEDLWNQFLLAHRARRAAASDDDDEGSESGGGGLPPEPKPARSGSVTRASERGSSRE